MLKKLPASDTTLSLGRCRAKSTTIPFILYWTELRFGYRKQAVGFTVVQNLEAGSSIVKCAGLQLGQICLDGELPSPVKQAV